MHVWFLELKSHDEICQNEWRRAKLTASVYERCLLMATWHLPISSFPGASEDLECQHLLDLDDACDFKRAFWDKISHWSNDKKSYLISWVHSLGDWGAFKTYMGHIKVNPVSDNENLTVVMNPQLLFSTFPSVMETQTAPNLGMDQIWHFVNQNWNVTGKLYWNTHFLRFQTQKHLFYRPPYD